jgi:hypothetical protein
VEHSLRYTRFVYGLAQFGSTKQRTYTRSMLVELSDLPGSDWRVTGNRAWRTGLFGKPSEIWQRARVAGKFTATRTFHQPTIPRWLMVKVTPVASIEDAEEVVPVLMSLSMPNFAAKITVTGEESVPNVSVEGLTNPWVYEQLTDGMAEGPTASRYVAGHIDQVAFLIECSGFREGWPWDDVIAVAGKQVARIQTRLEATDFPRK